MKKLFLLLLVVSFTLAFTSCTDTFKEDEASIQAAEKDKICPPGNPNC
jgi:hypothetical protein